MPDQAPPQYPEDEWGLEQMRAHRNKNKHFYSPTKCSEGSEKGKKERLRQRLREAHDTNPNVYWSHGRLKAAGRAAGIAGVNCMKVEAIIAQLADTDAQEAEAAAAAAVQATLQRAHEDLTAALNAPTSQVPSTLEQENAALRQEVARLTAELAAATGSDVHAPTPPPAGADAPADPPADPPAEQPADPPAEQPANPPAEQPADPPDDSTDDEPGFEKYGVMGEVIGAEVAIGFFKTLAEARAEVKNCLYDYGNIIIFHAEGYNEDCDNCGTVPMIEQYHPKYGLYGWGSKHAAGEKFFKNQKEAKQAAHSGNYKEVFIYKADNYMYPFHILENVDEYPRIYHLVDGKPAKPADAPADPPAEQPAESADPPADPPAEPADDKPAEPAEPDKPTDPPADPKKLKTIKVKAEPAEPAKPAKPKKKLKTIKVKDEHAAES